MPPDLALWLARITLSRTYFHGTKDVRAVKVLLYKCNSFGPNGCSTDGGCTQIYFPISLLSIVCFYSFYFFPPKKKKKKKIKSGSIVSTFPLGLLIYFES